MGYIEDLNKKYEFERKSNNVMSIYTKISDDLYNKHVSKYSGLKHMYIDSSGIEYEYYNDYYDFSAGTSTFFVSREEIENLLEEYKRKERRNKLNKINEL